LGFIIFKSAKPINRLKHEFYHKQTRRVFASLIVARQIKTAVGENSDFWNSHKV